MLQVSNKIWLNKLIDVLSIQTNSSNEKLMILYLSKCLEQMDLRYNRDWFIDAAGNLLVIKGKAKTYPCVVAHMDTVHKFVGGFEVYKKYMHYYKTVNKKKITARRCLELHAYDNKNTTAGDFHDSVGVGGDDKCGVFACLYFLKILPAVKIVFFSREEVGCIGSRNVSHSFFEDCRYIIQLDRKNGHDFITNYCSGKTISHRFSSELGGLKKEFSFRSARGSVTDSVKLWDAGVGISCINLSAGYHNSHSSFEYVDVNELFNSINFVNAIIYHLKEMRYESKPKPIVPTKWKSITSTEPTKITFKQCAVCLQWRDEVALYKQKEKLVCFTCLHKIEKRVVSTPTTLTASTTITITPDLRQCHTCRDFVDIQAMYAYEGEYYCYGCYSQITKILNDTLYDCHGCHKAMIKGSTRRWRNGHFWCLDCVERLDLENDINDMPDEPVKEIICSICGYIILTEEKKHYLNGLPTCDNCWNDASDTLTIQTKSFLKDCENDKKNN